MMDVDVALDLRLMRANSPAACLRSLTLQLQGCGVTIERGSYDQDVFREKTCLEVKVELNSTRFTFSS